MKVELIGSYGGDKSHALSAWTSTGRELTEERKSRVPQLLARLAQDGHETPFEKSALHFLVTCDIASHIHIIKHRIGVSVNAESARYKEFQENKFYIPQDWPNHLQFALEAHMRNSFELYHSVCEELTETLGRKRAKESARLFLPYALEITSDVMFNFRSFVHFLRLRLDDHAQQEIHMIAEQMLHQVQELPQFKYSLEAFGYGSGI